MELGKLVEEIGKMEYLADVHTNGIRLDDLKALARRYEVLEDTASSAVERMDDLGEFEMADPLRTVLETK